MNPKTATNTPRADGFKPKYRHFHPNDRIWIQNPFDHDVVFQVADEYNRPFKYRLPAHKVSELPGGAIATLGVKAIVDELIQNSKGDEMQMWNENVRRKHENDVILREKRTELATDPDRPGEVDLSVRSNDEAEAVDEEVSTPPETAFPGLNDPEPIDDAVLAPLPPAANAGIDSIVASSLPATDAVASPNNTHANAEG
jgi:hypothetical protein